jgi:hypothetical protein
MARRSVELSADLRDIRPLTGILMGTLFILSGLTIVLVALGWVQVDTAKIHAPRWVIGVCGGVFAVAGAGVFYYGALNGLRGSTRAAAEREGGAFPVVAWLVGLVSAGGMTAVASWIAFGPGERAFSGSIGIGGVGVEGSAGSETLGRCVFGIGAVLAGLFTLWGLVHGLRRLTVRSRRDGP